MALSREVEQAATFGCATPVVVGSGEWNGRPFQIEQRLPGQSLLEELHDVDGERRERLIIDYLHTATTIGSVAIERPYFGELAHPEPVRAPSWQRYLLERATRSLDSSLMANIDIETISNRLGDGDGHLGLVHLDYCPANVLTDGLQITAVIDFGYATILGDTRMNAVAAVAHLLAPEISPSVRPEDRHTVNGWLHDNALTEYAEHATQWLAAYWTFAHDDASLFEWCRSVLDG